MKRIFEAAGLRVFDVEELPTHGGSLRIYGCRAESGHLEQAAVSEVLAEEKCRGMEDVGLLCRFFRFGLKKIKKPVFWLFLLEARQKGKSVAGYGAAAKGNTLLNFAGVRPDLLPFVCDAARAKQGKFLPGSHIPVLSPDVFSARRPDYLIILPWNIAEEVKKTECGTGGKGYRVSDLHSENPYCRQHHLTKQAGAITF